MESTEIRDIVRQELAALKRELLTDLLHYLGHKLGYHVQQMYIDGPSAGSLAVRIYLPPFSAARNPEEPFQ